mgnify:FL=1
MPDKDTTLWVTAAAALAAVGGYIGYYLKNKRRIRDVEWWVDAGADVLASTFIGVIVFLVASPFTGEMAAAGLAGYAGHVGTREVVRLIHRYLFRRGK